MNVYFPSCNFTKMYPEQAKKLRQYLAQRMPVAGCCRVDPKDYSQDTGLYFCQACREVLSPKMTVRSLWEYLDADDTFPWPDLQGETVLLQDCWRDRDQPAIHAVVRSILRKMNARVQEMEMSREKAEFCGNLHFEPKTEENLALLAANPDKPLYLLSHEEQVQLMREYVARLHTDLRIVTSCNRCTMGLLDGGANAVHLMALAMANL